MILSYCVFASASTRKGQHGAIGSPCNYPLANYHIADLQAPFVIFERTSRASISLICLCVTKPSYITRIILIRTWVSIGRKRISTALLKVCIERLNDQ